MQIPGNVSTRNSEYAAYLDIAKETLYQVVVTNKTLAGCLVNESLYGKVVFSQCNFWGCAFQNVTFENCIFEGCQWNFSHFRNCQFINCSFVECFWQASSTQSARFLNCEVEMQLKAMLEGKENSVSHIRPELSQTEIFECLLAS